MRLFGTRRRALALAGVPALGVAAIALSAPAALADPAGTAVRAPKGFVLRVERAERPSAGVVRLTVELSARGDEGASLALLNGDAPGFGQATGLAGLRVAAAGTGTVGTALTKGSDCVCTRIAVPAKGQAVLATVDLADPGGSALDVYPVAAQPVLGLAVSGTPSPAADLDQFDLRTTEAFTRSRTAAATVNKGKAVRVDLDTAVLFKLDSAALTPRANASLDAAAKALKQQSGRKLGIYGHTDSQGTTAHNLVLSQQRAVAVRDALATRLGAGWTFDVRGYGESKPLVPETGSASDVRQAQAKNRRVEVQVL
ncbi:OmpA family protein [Angustibacter sp. McL0619]|uniref:OmpA family protein n=1 Tax=Angustibacter sp. McL0619 TaxID=3415676 RepID=UPI003CF69B42